jgi:predicted transcriptional regulator
MSKKTPPKPTDAELIILHALWQINSGSVRDVLKKLNENRTLEYGYTTVLKLLQIMTEKGLVYRDETQRPQIYRASLTEEQTQRQFIRDLINKAFDGSTRKLVMQALTEKPASDQELFQIEMLLDKLEGESK